VMQNSASARPIPDRCVLPKLDIARDINVLSISAPLTAPSRALRRRKCPSTPAGLRRAVNARKANWCIEFCGPHGTTVPTPS
jgi:hypothetical protein